VSCHPFSLRKSTLVLWGPFLCWPPSAAMMLIQHHHIDISALSLSWSDGFLFLCLLAMRSGMREGATQLEMHLKVGICSCQPCCGHQQQHPCDCTKHHYHLACQSSLLSCVLLFASGGAAPKLFSLLAHSHSSAPPCRPLSKRSSKRPTSRNRKKLRNQSRPPLVLILRLQSLPTKLILDRWFRSDDINNRAGSRFN